MNPFLDILTIAVQNHWCVKPFCTTCGANEFRNSLQVLAHSSHNSLVEALSMLDINELRIFPDWDDALRIALGEIKNALDMDKVLKGWLPHLDANVVLADIVLFYFVRRGALRVPMSIEVLSEWLDACIALALRTYNESLLESLVYTLGSEIQDYKELWAAVVDISGKSRKIQLALQRRELFVKGCNA